MSAVTTKPKHCDLASIGYSVDGDDAERIEAVFNLYLIDFIAPCDCILCGKQLGGLMGTCLLYTSPSPRDGLLSRMPSSA